MNKIFSTLGAITIAILIAGHAQANGRGSSGHSTSHGSYGHASYGHASNYHTSYNNHGGYGRPTSYGNYHLTYGTRFSGGYYYRGRSHSHWTSQRFDSRYGCTCYYDPCCSSWYYWCQPANCYYPINYCPYRTYCFNGGCTGGVAVVPSGPVAPIGPGPVGPGPVNPGPVPPMPPTGPVSTDNFPPIPAPPSN